MFWIRPSESFSTISQCSWKQQNFIITVWSLLLLGLGCLIATKTKFLRFHHHLFPSSAKERKKKELKQSWLDPSREKFQLSHRKSQFHTGEKKNEFRNVKNLHKLELERNSFSAVKESRTTLKIDSVGGESFKFRCGGMRYERQGGRGEVVEGFYRLSRGWKGLMKLWS